MNVALHRSTNTSYQVLKLPIEFHVSFSWFYTFLGLSVTSYWHTWHLSSGFWLQSVLCTTVRLDILFICIWDYMNINHNNANEWFISLYIYECFHRPLMHGAKIVSHCGIHFCVIWWDHELCLILSAWLGVFDDQSPNPFSFFSSALVLGFAIDA